MISKGVTHTKLLSAPAVVGESAMLTQSMPELARRSASFRALGRSCTAWRLSMDDLQVCSQISAAAHTTVMMIIHFLGVHSWERDYLTMTHTTVGNKFISCILLRC